MLFLNKTFPATMLEGLFSFSVEMVIRLSSTTAGDSLEFLNTVKEEILDVCLMFMTFPLAAQLVAVLEKVINAHTASVSK